MELRADNPLQPRKGGQSCWHGEGTVGWSTNQSKGKRLYHQSDRGTTGGEESLNYYHPFVGRKKKSITSSTKKDVTGKRRWGSDHFTGEKKRNPQKLEGDGIFSRSGNKLSTRTIKKKKG